MFGYWATGRNDAAARPNTVMKILITAANRGWSMKKCESFMARLSSGSDRPEGDRSGLRRYFRARPGRWDAVDDHAVGGGEARADDPQTVAEIAQLDLLRRHNVVRPDGQDDVLRLIGQYRSIRHEQGRRRRRDRQADTGEAARRQKQIAVGDGGARMDRAARPIERVVDEVERALASEGFSSLSDTSTLSASGPFCDCRSRRNVM